MPEQASRAGSAPRAPRNVEGMLQQASRINAKLAAQLERTQIMRSRLLGAGKIDAAADQRSNALTPVASSELGELGKTLTLIENQLESLDEELNDLERV